MSGRRCRAEMLVQPAVKFARLERSELVGHLETMQHVSLFCGKDHGAVPLRGRGPHDHRADDIALGVGNHMDFQEKPPPWSEKVQVP